MAAFYCEEPEFVLVVRISEQESDGGFESPPHMQRQHFPAAGMSHIGKKKCHSLKHGQQILIQLSQ